jgi:hypothetical protein
VEKSEDEWDIRELICKRYRRLIRGGIGMNHEKDMLEEVLKDSIETEEALMRTYLISAERVQDDDELKERLENFAQGNAKRTKQLIDELHEMEEE